MDRRSLLTGALGLAASTGHAAAPAVRTRWTIRTSEGFDAIAFLGPLTGKPFYADRYPSEVAAFEPGLTAEALAALASLEQAWAAAGDLLWPSLAVIVSGGPDATLGDVLAGLEDPERRLKAPFAASPYWDPEVWTRFIAHLPQLRAILSAMATAGFGAFRRPYIEAAAAKRAGELKSLLGGLDVIAEQERLLGRRLDPGIEVTLLWFSKPHGVKVQGQRFLTHVDYPDSVVVLTAAHEILHPPFNMKGPAARAALAVLEKDSLLTRILAEHDRDAGYNDLEGLLNEDVVQALDQIIQERLGYGKTPSERWASADGGMHVLAAGLYGLLKADGYDHTGGDIEAWMLAAARGGRLAPQSWRPAAARVLGKPVDRLWETPTRPVVRGAQLG